VLLSVLLAEKHQLVPLEKARDDETLPYGSRQRKPGLGAHIWISYSPDLRHWGGHRVILEARRGGWWDANKIGLCSPSIETEKAGWQFITARAIATKISSSRDLTLARSMEGPPRISSGPQEALILVWHRAMPLDDSSSHGLRSSPGNFFRLFGCFG